MVRSDVQSIKNELTGLRADVSAGNLDAARADADSIASKAHTAHGLTSGPAWWTAAHLPWLGRPAEVVRVVTAQADSLGHNAVPGVLDLADEVSNGGFRNGKTIDLAKLAERRADRRARVRPGQCVLPGGRATAQAHLAVVARPVAQQVPDRAVDDQRRTGRRHTGVARPPGGARRGRAQAVLPGIRERGRGARTRRYPGSVRDPGGRSRNAAVRALRRRQRTGRARPALRPGRRLHCGLRRRPDPGSSSPTPTSAPTFPTPRRSGRPTG